MESVKDIPTAKSSIGLRIFGIIIGFLCLIWLPFEDTSTFYTVGLAVMICAWLAFRVVVQTKPHLNHHILIGTATGIAVVPITIVLMAVKSGIHAHGFADFQRLQVLQVIATFPYWTLGGLLIGLIVGVCRKRFTHTKFEEN